MSQPTASQAMGGKRKQPFATLNTTQFKKIRIRKDPPVKPSVRSMTEIRRLVAREILKKAEQKIRVQSVTNFGITGANGGAPTSIYLAPLLSQGTADNQRVGNRVNVTSSSMNLFFNLLPYNAVTNANNLPVYVKIWIASYRIRNTATIANTSVATDFFQNDGSTNGFAGNMLDMVYGVNEQSWDLKETRCFKLGVGEALSTGGANTASWLDNSSFAQEVKFDFTPYLKGMFEYNDNTNVPTNRNLWMFIQVVAADGTNSGGYTPVEVHNSQMTKFVDP